MTESAASGIAIMGNANIPGEQANVFFIENFFGETQPLFFVHTIIISHDPGCILAAVLQVDNAIKKLSGNKFMRIDSSYSTHYIKSTSLADRPIYFLGVKFMSVCLSSSEIFNSETNSAMDFASIACPLVISFSCS